MFWAHGWHISSHNPTKSCSLFLGYQETKANHINVQWCSYILNNSTQHTLHINYILYIYIYLFNLINTRIIMYYMFNKPWNHSITIPFSKIKILLARADTLAKPFVQGWHVGMEARCVTLGVIGNSQLGNTMKLGSVVNNHIINFDVVYYLVILKFWQLYYIYILL